MGEDQYLILTFVHNQISTLIQLRGIEYIRIVSTHDIRFFTLLYSLISLHRAHNRFSYLNLICK